MYIFCLHVFFASFLTKKKSQFRQESVWFLLFVLFSVTAEVPDLFCGLAVAVLFILLCLYPVRLMPGVWYIIYFPLFI